MFANQYRWTSKEGIRTDITFNTNFDNIINRYKNDEFMEGAFLIDCVIWRQMPRIMRYCLEQDIDLRCREYLSSLPMGEEYADETKKFGMEMSIPLRSDCGITRSENGNLVICSFPEKMGGKVSFKKQDVPQFVEGIIRVLDCDGVRGAHFRCVDIVQNYMSYYYMLRKDSKRKPKQ